jgi:PilZ domain
MRLSEEILDTIVWSLAAKSPESLYSGANQRRHPRSLSHTHATIYFGTPGMTRNVAIRDVSADGVSLISPEPMQIGESFVLSVSPMAKTSAIVCRVMHCGQEPDHYRIGASFIGFA